MTGTDDRIKRFSALDEPLCEAAIWASLLDRVVDGMGRLPGMSKSEVTIVCGELNNVNDALQAAIDKVHAIYHGHEAEEART